MELDIHIDFGPLEPLQEFFDEASFEKLRQWYEDEFRKRYRASFNSPDVLARRLLLSLRFGLAVNAKSKISELEVMARNKVHELRMKGRDRQIERIVREAERAAAFIDQSPQRVQDIELWLGRYDSWVDSHLVSAMGKVGYFSGLGVAKGVETTWRITGFVADKVGTALGYGVVLLIYGGYRVLVVVSQKTLMAMRTAENRTR